MVSGLLDSKDVARVLKYMLTLYHVKHGNGLSRL